MHIPCWFPFFIWGVSLKHSILASFLSREFLLHILCWFHFYLGSCSYTSRAGVIFIYGVSLTHPELASFYFSIFSDTSGGDFYLCGEFLLHIPAASFLFGEFLLHIPCWFHFYLRRFSYTSRAVLFCLFVFFSWSFSWGVSLTHPVLVEF